MPRMKFRELMKYLKQLKWGKERQEIMKNYSMHKLAFWIKKTQN